MRVGGARLALILSAASVCVLGAELAPEASTSFGPVQGVWLRTARGLDVAGFLGLPYAEPPVGELRFQVMRSCIVFSGRTREGVFGISRANFYVGTQYS